jgi:hypothetical protein
MYSPDFPYIHGAKDKKKPSPRPTKTLIMGELERRTSGRCLIVLFPHYWGLGGDLPAL